MPNISWEGLSRLIFAFTFVVVVTFGGAIAVTELGLVGLSTTMAALAGVLAAVFAFHQIINTSDSQPLNPTSQPDSLEETPVPPRTAPPEELSVRERVQRMEADDAYHSTKRTIRSSRLRKIIRWLIFRTPLTLYHIEVLLYGLGVIGVLTSLPFLLRLLWRLVDLHPWLVTISTLIPVETTFIGDLYLFLIFLIFVFPALTYYAIRQQSECEECGAPLSMKYNMTYWRGEDEKVVPKVNNEGNEYSVTRYRGKAVYECENCGKMAILGDVWEENG